MSIFYMAVKLTYVDIKNVECDQQLFQLLQWFDRLRQSGLSINRCVHKGPE